MTKLQMNGTVKTIGIIVITGIAVGALVWGIALDSGDLGRCTTDVVELKTATAATQASIHEIEKSMIVMQGDVSLVKQNVGHILTLQRRSLGLPEPPE